MKDVCNTVVTSPFNTWTFLHADIKDDLDLNTRLKGYESDLDFAANVPFALEHFSYNNFGVLELVYGYLNQTKFGGITVSKLQRAKYA